MDIKTETYKTFDGQDVMLGAEDVRRLCGKNGQHLTDGEIDLFIKTAKYRRLNPYLNELYILKNAPFVNDRGETKEPAPAQIIISRQAVMMIAEEHPAYDGLQHGIVVLNSDGKVEDREGCILLQGETLIGGWAKVYRKDRKIPFLCRIDLKEFSKQRNDNTPYSKKEKDGTWDKMTKTMIDKCAVVTTLRSAFPQQLGGLYTQDEVDNSNFNSDKDTTEPTPEEKKPTIAIPVEIPISEELGKEEPIPTEELPFPETTTEQINEEKSFEINGEHYPIGEYNEAEKLWYVQEEYFLEHKDGLQIVDKFIEGEHRIPVQRRS